MASIESPDLLPDLRRQFHSVSRAFRQQEQTAALPVVPFVLLLWSEPGLWCSSIIIAPTHHALSATGRYPEVMTSLLTRQTRSVSRPG